MWKVLKFKYKRILLRTARPVLKKYEGRSKVACMKARLKGRFITNKKARKKFFVVNN
jgi:hypothetical protein